MNIIVADHYEALSKEAAKIIEEQLQTKLGSVLGLATGSTPLGLYEELIQGHRERDVSYKHVHTLNLDEYVGLDKHHPQSYHVFMNKRLFNHINIPLKQTHIPSGDASSLLDECKRYELVIDEVGPPDIQVLGIGQNGHIGFNEPGSSFAGITHITELAHSTREANARFFSSPEDVPTHAITMGIKSILKSKHILLLASGAKKAAAIQRLLTGEANEAFPASALYGHPNVTLIVDKEAYKEME
ncbi:glucosamine-6-phosphate deaminase [Jeotgalibacillus soli]|uniref:Glucosamine-6-phosphate deaminase n=1 Tax=Jeotgalibacillus soli TaxID=889306 RepID=A0A0C2W041_9BACL|nr:glucosamine-6-phosphate deaminase [Jeotgalibacillus soli]KIL49533.1 glucosamine-6-phosphate deaminase [Jeotgalibacillus soli]